MVENLTALGLEMAFWIVLLVVLFAALIRSGRVVPAPWVTMGRHRQKPRSESLTSRQP